MLNLDTHILLFALAGRLREREATLLSENDWSISAIVLWEIAKLSRLGRIELDLDDPLVENIFSVIHIWPLNFDIAKFSCLLDFRGDLADEIIAATSVIHNIPLLSRDAQILGSKLVPLA